ncbi:hypothetical protein NliqN6_5459 [Naganishia liquefaciens]|uniref:Uncharacterized protein n=1 Tax=Naganishia liquefaciens TaxID=104408 RepID=A0A8H3TXS6_9TREE|nr:hypothetical protein NliqN6_5459 [Naganishia liquefaciens]
MSSLSTNKSKRIHASDEQTRSRQGSANVMEEMENARKTVRRAQAMGWIKTAPFSISTPSASSHSDSSFSFVSTFSTSQDGSIATGSEETGFGVPRIEGEDEEEMATPKPEASSRMAPMFPAMAMPFRRTGQNASESSPQVRKVSSGSVYSPASPANYDGGMVASTGWLITVVPPDSLYYAFNGESHDVPPDAFASPNQSNTEDNTAEGLDRVLATARLKKWRKGKILPLASDLKGMMRAIGKEWNLPSEIGMEVYLASGTKEYDQGPRQRSGTEDGEMEEEMVGMLSDETWRMVWAEYISEAEGMRLRAAIGRYVAQPDPRTIPGRDRQHLEAKDAASNESERRDLQEGDSPSSPELPLTGNTFGSTNQPFAELSQDVSPALNPVDLPHGSIPAAHHIDTLTPDSSQTSFGPSSVPPPKDILSSAAQTMLSPSPSSVFPGASSSQQASPMSAFGSRSNGNAMQRRVLGKIEFDFDSGPGSRGEWYSTWLKRRVQTRQRREDADNDNSSGLGMRPLRLASRNSPSAKSDTSEYVEQPETAEGQAEYAPLMDEDEDEPTNGHTESPRSISPSSDQEDVQLDHLVSGALNAAFPEGSDDFVHAFASGHIGNQAAQPTYSWKDIGSQRILEDSVKLEQLAPPPVLENDREVDMAEIRQMLETKNAKAVNQELLVPAHRGQLLASPIDLTSPQIDNSPQPQSLLVTRPDALSIEPPPDGSTTVHGLGMGIDMDDEEAKRGSAVVISSQLDILERALRELSPRDIRFSVYPGLPDPSTIVPAEEPTSYAVDDDTSSRASSRQAQQRFSDATEESLPETTATIPSRDYSVAPLTARIQTPILATEPIFARTPDAYASYQNFTPRTVPNGKQPTSLSLETMSRMEYEAGYGNNSTELPKKSPGWKPTRPARPPSPHLEQYTAPSPHLKLSDTPPPASMTVIDTRGLSKSPEEPVIERPRVPSGSKSMNKLNRLFNRRVSEKSTDESKESAGQTVSVEAADQGTASKSPKPNDSFGRRFFKGLHVKSPSSSHETFSTAVISDPVVVSTTNKQAYQLSQLQQQQASPPAPPIPEKAVSIAPRSIPSSPSLDTLHTAKTSQHAFGTPTIPTSPSLNTIMSAAGPASSPNSPSMAGGAAVRRKPVPRREGDESLPTSQSVRSITSFVLEDAPKRARKVT